MLSCTWQAIVHALMGSIPLEGVTSCAGMQQNMQTGANHLAYVWVFVLENGITFS